MFALLKFFMFLINGYNFCINGSHCYTSSYYNYKTIWPYHIVIHIGCYGWFGKEFGNLSTCIMNWWVAPYCKRRFGVLTLWGLGTWNFNSPRDWALFGDFLFFFSLTQSFICHGNQFSSLFIILQVHMSLWPQCDTFFAPPSLWCSKWHQNDATMMLQQRDISLTRDGHICPSSPVRVKPPIIIENNRNVPQKKMVIISKC